MSRIDYNTYKPYKVKDSYGKTVRAFDPYKEALYYINNSDVIDLAINP